MPKVFNEFGIIMTSLKETGHRNFNIAKAHIVTIV